jgi:hypothetical protein
MNLLVRGLRVTVGVVVLRMDVGALALMAPNMCFVRFEVPTSLLSHSKLASGSYHGIVRSFVS